MPPLDFRDASLERRYGLHISRTRAKHEWMGMILEASLWIAGVRRFRLSCLVLELIAGAAFELIQLFYCSFRLFPAFDKAVFPRLSCEYISR